MINYPAGDDAGFLEGFYS